METCANNTFSFFFVFDAKEVERICFRVASHVIGFNEAYISPSSSVPAFNKAFKFTYSSHTFFAMDFAQDKIRSERQIK